MAALRCAFVRFLGSCSSGFAVAIVSGWLLSARAAHAETIALERFHPAPAGDRFLGVPSPYVAGDLELHAALLVDYAYEPLRIHAPPADVQALVSYQAVLHANLSLPLANRVLLNLDVPALSIQAGETADGPGKVEFGDVRVGGRIRLLGDNGSPLQLGLGGYFWVPTATGTTAGDGKPRGMPYLAIGGLSGPILWTGMLGAEFRFSQEYAGVVRQGSALSAGAGVSYFLDDRHELQVGLESTASLVLAEPSSRNFNAELLFDGRYRFLDRFEAGIGVGPGLTNGVGTPTARVVLLLAYVPDAELFPPWRPASEAPSVAGESLLWRSARRTPIEGSAPHLRCCEAPPPERARRRGAWLEQGYIVTSSPGILFEVGSAAPSARAESVLHAIADFLAAHPEIRKVEIGGHTDLHGTLESNAELGARRAEAIEKLLIRHSVSPERLTTKSYGASAPLASSATAEGMRHNRTVVFRVLELAPTAPPAKE